MVVQTRPPRRGLIVVTAAIAVVVTAVALFSASVVRGDPTRQVTAETSAVAVAVYDRDTDRLLRDEGANQQFRAASLVKLLIAIDLVQRGHVTPQRPSPRVRRMLATSDDAIATQLWASGGGTQIVRRTVASLGLEHTEPPADPGRWGDTLVTTQDVLRVYRAVLEMSPAQRRLLLEPLREAPRQAADGTDQHFGIPDALPGRSWAIKQGWAAGRGGVDAHTSGLVGPADRYVIVVLTHRPSGTGLANAALQLTATTAELEPLLE